MTPAARRKSRVRHLYGIEVADVDRMIADQDGRCPICKAELIEPQVDHCHATGRVRGVLCRRCNIALGYFDDDSTRIGRAVAYLKR